MIPHPDSADWYDTYSIRRGGNTLKFLASSSVIQARNYGDTVYGSFEAASFTPVSRREWKKNIVEFDRSGLDIVNSTKVYEYNFKEESDSAMKSIGMILEESPMEIIDLGGRGMSLYPMVSVLWKAVQELKSEIDILKGDVVKWQKLKY
jgi:hypothetical protein